MTKACQHKERPGSSPEKQTKMEMENGFAPRNWEAFFWLLIFFLLQPSAIFHGTTTTDICINYHLVSQNKKRCRDGKDIPLADSQGELSGGLGAG